MKMIIANIHLFIVTFPISLLFTQSFYLLLFLIFIEILLFVYTFSTFIINENPNNKADLESLSLSNQKWIYLSNRLNKNCKQIFLTNYQLQNKWLSFILIRYRKKCVNITTNVTPIEGRFRNIYKHLIQFLQMNDS